MFNPIKNSQIKYSANPTYNNQTKINVQNNNKNIYNEVMCMENFQLL